MLGILPANLDPLFEEHIEAMLKEVAKNEPVFRNILLDMAEDETEGTLFRDGTIDQIFDKYVRTNGYVTRVSDYCLGPNGNTRPNLLDNQALISIQSPGPSYTKLYKVLPDNNVKFIEDVSTLMH